jgi:integrase/recombinase XerC
VAVTAHKLRHTFTTRLLREHHVDLVTTAVVLGHENVNTTAIYTQPTEADQEEAVDKLASWNYPRNALGACQNALQ